MRRCPGPSGLAPLSLWFIPPVTPGLAPLSGTLAPASGNSWRHH